MDGGHLEGQCGGMFVVFFQGIRSVGRFTGRLAFMLSVAMEGDVNHFSLLSKKDVAVDFQQVDYGCIGAVFAL